jgi:hypothetical protein
VEAKIVLDGEEGRAQYQRTLIPESQNKLGTHEMCPVFRDGDTISGKVHNRLRNAPLIGR